MSDPVYYSTFKFGNTPELGFTTTTTYCPKPIDCEFEPGITESLTFDNSPVYFGTPSYHLVWDFMTPDDAALLWAAYRSQYKTGEPISITVPNQTGDSDDHFWEGTTAFITMPEGTLGGDLIENFGFWVYNVHEDQARKAMQVYGRVYDVWTMMVTGDTLELGDSNELYGDDWSF